LLAFAEEKQQIELIDATFGLHPCGFCFLSQGALPLDSSAEFLDTQA
jgi:hypothetical protein